jgi:hypothetical protein
MSNLTEVVREKLWFGTQSLVIFVLVFDLGKRYSRLEGVVDLPAVPSCVLVVTVVVLFGEPEDGCVVCVDLVS